MVRNARRRLRRSATPRPGRRVRSSTSSKCLPSGSNRIAAQTRQRVVEGVTPPGATRLVSLHDPDARPIAKGRLGKPVEFGYKAQIVDNEDGVILDHNIEVGNPPDAPMLVPAIERITRRAGRAPRAVTADRGYGEPAVEDALRDLGVRHVVLPRKGRPNAARREIEQRRAFKKMVRWRTGCEGRISCAKRDFGLAAPASTDSTAPEPGAATASSPTTSSRSPASSHEHLAARTHDGSAEPPALIAHPRYFRSK